MTSDTQVQTEMPRDAGKVAQEASRLPGSPIAEDVDRGRRCEATGPWNVEAPDTIYHRAGRQWLGYVAR